MALLESLNYEVNELRTSGMFVYLNLFNDVCFYLYNGQQHSFESYKIGSILELLLRTSHRFLMNIIQIQ